ncbi:MAG: DNA repair protein RecN [Mariprofundales bacterium]
MLTELHIQQFALIDQISITLQTGATVFSGETGAGKSIIVDALGAVFGSRARTDWVRHGAEKAQIHALLTLPPQSPALQWLQQQELDDDEQLLLRRVISVDGRSRAWINGTPCPRKLLQQLGDILLDLHGQHEHQALLQADFQRQLIDNAIDPTLRQQLAQGWQKLHQAKGNLQQWMQTQAQLEREAEWMQRELNQLQELSPQPGLEEVLEQQTHQLRHASNIQQAAASAIHQLDEAEPSVRSQLAAVLHILDGAGNLHPAIAEAHGFMQQAELLLDETVTSLRPALEIHSDTAELDRCEARVALLQELMRRHHTDSAGLCDLMQQWQQQLSDREHAAWDQQQLEQTVEQAETIWRSKAEEMHQARLNQSTLLVKALRPLLDRLGLSTMRIEIKVEADDATPSVHGATGWDCVRFMASSNPGEPFKPLADVASGGELSRIVLALKGCGSLRAAPEIAVFDEVDVGIGGETAWCVGELLAAMGQERQVLVVSHLPQVAASCHHQLHIDKQQRDGRTTINLQPLDDSGREDEIARMLGGADESSVVQAKRMLARGATSRCPR